MKTKTNPTPSIFDDNQEATTYITQNRVNSKFTAVNGSMHEDLAVYIEIGALKATIHRMAQQIPEVEAYLANINAYDRASRSRQQILAELGL